VVARLSIGALVDGLTSHVKKEISESCLHEASSDRLAALSVTN
jgi:hypothetical protein